MMDCSTFLRMGWSVVRSASLAKGDTSKKRWSLHLHKVLTQSSKVSPRTFQTALICLKNTYPIAVNDFYGRNKYILL
jgi:hypothetical protein